MAVPLTVPIEVKPEATARIEDLGMQSEFEQMLEHTRQTVTDLQSIDVSVYNDPYEPDEPRIVITAWKEGPGTVDDPTRATWVNWYVEAFPPGVCRWFSFEVAYRTDDER